MKIFFEKCLERHRTAARSLGVAILFDESHELTYGWSRAGELALLVEVMLRDALDAVCPGGRIEVSFGESAQDITVCVRLATWPFYADDPHASRAVALSLGGRFERQELPRREIALRCSIPAESFSDVALA